MEEAAMRRSRKHSDDDPVRSDDSRVVTFDHPLVPGGGKIEVEGDTLPFDRPTPDSRDR